jgi:hypothetical protein
MTWDHYISLLPISQHPCSKHSKYALPVP